MTMFGSQWFAGAAAAAAAVDFDPTLIGNSVWLDGSSDYLSRSTSSFSSNEVTMACWFQLLDPLGSSIHGLIGLGDDANNGATNNGLYVENGVFYFYANGQGAKPNAKLRDIGWYHALGSWKLDETGAAKGKLYINGTEITSWSDDRRSSFGTSFGNNSKELVGSVASSRGKIYIAQPIILDGQSIQGGDFSISDFVGTQTFGTNGSQFIPKADADIAALASSAGGNSFCLDFSDSSNLGNDISNNTNDLTANSMSSANQSISTPSKVYSTFNPLASADNGGLAVFTLSEGNTKNVLNSSNTSVKTTLPFVMSGSNIIRTQFTFNTVGDGACGITGSMHTSGTYYSASNSIAGRGEVLLLDDGSLVIDGSFGGSGYLSALSNGDVVDVIVNLDAGAVYFARNGTLGGGDTQSEIQAGTTTNAALVSSFVRRTAGEVFNFYAAQYNPTSSTITYNSGQSSFSNSYSSITSLVSLNTADLEAPDYQGRDYFHAAIYVGNNTSINDGGITVTGTGWKPDLAWMNSMDSYTSNVVYDSVRGTTKRIIPDLADAESTLSEGLTSFNNDGFTHGNDWYSNRNNEDHIAWQWRAGNSTSTNTDGSLDTTVSVAAADHFSIVGWTQASTAAAQTLGHGLSAAPELILVKNRSDSAAWSVYSEFAGNTKYLVFDTNAAATTSNVWQDTSPTSTVFSVSNDNTTSGSANDEMIAYCFRSVRGVCKVGTYTGNGSSSHGPYVSLGFRPRWVMIKSLATNHWIVWDTARSTYNSSQSTMFVDYGSNENTSNAYMGSFFADGFRPDSSYSTMNSNGTNYIYLAMADIAGGGTLPPIYGR